MRKNRRSWYTQLSLIELFVVEVTARVTARLVRINKTTASYYFQRLQQLIYDHSDHLKYLDGEVDENCSVIGGKESVTEVSWRSAFEFLKVV